GADRRHEDARDLGALLADGLLHGVVDRHVLRARRSLEGLPAAAGGDAGDHLGAVGEAAAGVQAARLAGDALEDDARVLVDENAHGRTPQAFTAATIFFAPSSIDAALWMARPLSSRIFLPRSTFVPSRRTTSGTFRPSSFVAATTAFAMMSQRMMPPKML